MSNQLPVKFADSVELTIPEFDTRPSIALSLNSIKHGEGRLIEAKIVNGATYSELEYVFNEAYREARKNLTAVGYEITQAEKTVRRIKGEHILDNYPKFLKESGLKDNAANRDAFLSKQEDYEDSIDRVSMLKAMENMFTDKIKVFENVCRYMKKEMDIRIRSGILSDKLTS